MNSRLGEGHIDPLEEGAVHEAIQAMPQGTIERGAQTSEEVQGAMIPRRRIQETLHQWPQPLNH